MKNPAVLLYTSDFITGTLFMSNEEVGAYIRLLCMQHQKGHLSKEEIKQICKDNNVFNSVIVHFKRDEKGFYYNERMELEKEKRNKYSESRANNRKKKEEKPKKDMKKISKTYEKHMENENINNNINNNIYFNNIELNNIFIEWLKYKKERKETYKETGLKSLITQINNQIDIYGEEQVIDLITECMANNYKGIIFDKLKNKPPMPYHKKQSVEPEWLGKEIKKGDFSEETERLCREVFGHNKE